MPDAIERLILNFQENRGSNENLRTFLARYSNEQIRNILAGEQFLAVERDVPVGRTPTGVEG